MIRSRRRSSRTLCRFFAQLRGFSARRFGLHFGLLEFMFLLGLYALLRFLSRDALPLLLRLSLLRLSSLL